MVVKPQFYFLPSPADFATCRSPSGTLLLTKLARSIKLWTDVRSSNFLKVFS
jgi:hypothetical protein